jgi:hypothetical protein
MPLSFAFAIFESMGYFFIHHHIYYFLAHASLAWHLLFLSYFCIAQSFFFGEIWRERFITRMMEFLFWWMAMHVFA